MTSDRARHRWRVATSFTRILVVIAVGLAVGCDRGEAPRSLPTTTPAATSQPFSEPHRTMLDQLNDPNVNDEEKLVIIERLAADSSELATGVLVAAIPNPSPIVAAASIRALRGRPCVDVATVLITTLRSDDWERRAWAAKVLGESRCTEAVDALVDALAREDDGRVQRIVQAAIDGLREETKEGEP